MKNSETRIYVNSFPWKYPQFLTSTTSTMIITDAYSPLPQLPPSDIKIMLFKDRSFVQTESRSLNSSSLASSCGSCLPDASLPDFFSRSVPTHRKEMLDLNRRNMTAKDKISRLNFKAYLPYQGETRHQVTGACLIQSSRHTTTFRLELHSFPNGTKSTLSRQKYQY